MNRKISSSSSAARTFGDCGAARVMASICELCAIVPKTGRKIHGIKNLSENILTKYSIINKMAFMKVYIIIGIMVLSIVLGICIYVYGQEKSIPENTLAVLQIEENSIYLMEIQKVPLEMHDESMRIIGNGDYYIEYTTISKDYPQNYTMQTFYVHIIPE
ncbi:MAG: hypothetical protein LBJ59_06100, partial [Zoogloeaceae bacterium]|nr:hypothetical protein [Zoogloeaceae bacterium]